MVKEVAVSDRSNGRCGWLRVIRLRSRWLVGKYPIETILPMVSLHG